MLDEKLKLQRREFGRWDTLLEKWSLYFTKMGAWGDWSWWKEREIEFKLKRGWVEDLKTLISPRRPVISEVKGDVSRHRRTST